MRWIAINGEGDFSVLFLLCGMAEAIVNSVGCLRMCWVKAPSLGWLIPRVYSTGMCFLRSSLL